jgi:hypothetical protein
MCKKTNDLFFNLEEIFHSNFHPLVENDRETQIKENALDRIFGNHLNTLRDALNKWRNKAE